MNKLIRTGFFLATLVLLPVILAAQIKSDFSSNADGWTVFDLSAGSSSAPTYNATGGNPSTGGDIAFSTSSPAAVYFYFNGPAKFTGNLSTSYNQNLTFDLMQSFAGADNSTGDVVLNNAAMGLTLVYQLPAKTECRVVVLLHCPAK